MLRAFRPRYPAARRCARVVCPDVGGSLASHCSYVANGRLVPQDAAGPILLVRVSDGEHDYGGGMIGPERRTRLADFQR